jgi:hypothetical protein
MTPWTLGDLSCPSLKSPTLEEPRYAHEKQNRGRDIDFDQRPINAKMVQCGVWPSVLGVGSMDDAVERVMASYENLPALELLGREEIRVKIGQYLAKLSSAGHSDAEELTFFGLAYLRILHEGPDPRSTGC